MTEAIAKQNINIRQIEAGTEDSGRGLIEVMVEVRDRKHFEKLRQSICALPGVLEVDRLMSPVQSSEPN